jgi:hypothetical protein
MQDEEHKTKEQLMNELVELRQRVAELETLEIERKRVEEAQRSREGKGLITLHNIRAVPRNPQGELTAEKICCIPFGSTRSWAYGLFKE